MEFAELNHHPANGTQVPPTISSQASSPLGGGYAANPPGDNSDGNWENAWIDLGGEG